jgi:hypothetical protein
MAAEEEFGYPEFLIWLQSLISQLNVNFRDAFH